ncbi:hypothetical protein [Candidatus Gromoviella agglomerans]|uniref:hypothetical protein n=1 Tax=Candidatus Gromoviella agglomerans TaxID=2806609 RepID=UPI001E3CDF4C|nr:hypothetical protein [Candidatus Gromoviella agglomerans]UFX98482.1 hypothetical protein Gromo_00392 [Candidatus Gromoviella agglomerans]
MVLNLTALFVIFALTTTFSMHSRKEPILGDKQEETNSQKNTLKEDWLEQNNQLLEDTIKMKKEMEVLFAEYQVSQANGYKNMPDLLNELAKYKQQLCSVNNKFKHLREAFLSRPADDMQEKALGDPMVNIFKVIVECVQLDSDCMKIYFAGLGIGKNIQNPS